MDCTHSRCYLCEVENGSATSCLLNVQEVVSVVLVDTYEVLAKVATSIELSLGVQILAVILDYIEIERSRASDLINLREPV